MKLSGAPSALGAKICDFLWVRKSAIFFGCDEQSSSLSGGDF